MDDQNQSSASLTAREHQVMMLAVLGLSNKAIAQQLHVSEGTIRVHLHTIYRKMRVTNRTALVPRLRDRSREPIPIKG